MGSEAVLLPKGMRLKVFLAYTAAEFAQAYSPAQWAQLSAAVQVRRNDHTKVLAGAQLVQAARDCDVILAYRSTACDASVLEALPQLRAVVRAAVDVSTIDVARASELGILVVRGSPGFQRSVAELALGMMIDLARGVTATRWRAASGATVVPPLGRELRGATLGLIGYGGIAQALQPLAEALGMQCLAYDPYGHSDRVQMIDLQPLLARSDFVVCLAASTPQTWGLINAQTLSYMKKTAYLLNLSRGELVDEAALEQALDQGLIAGAALDVGSASDQKPAARFFNRPDVVLSPHIGATTVQARAHQTQCSIDQVLALARGEVPQGSLNAAVAHRLAVA